MRKWEFLYTTEVQIGTNLAVLRKVDDKHSIWPMNFTIG